MEQQEIKFRLWCKHCKKMRLDVVILSQHGVTVKEGAPHFVEWMQFTGLKDKNGKEIFEGDVLRAYRRRTEMIFEVFWDVAWCGFKIKYPTMDWNAALGFDAPYEVIGNIYENPDLLTPTA